MRISDGNFSEIAHPHPHPHPLAGIRAGILGYPPSKGPATDRLEGSPSSRRGTCTLTAGRKPFQSTRYMYLVDWKDTLPAGEVHVPRRLEGLPSSRPCPLPAAGILWDTRIPASNLRKRGHPHLLAGIRWHRRVRVSATDTLRPSLASAPSPSDRPWTCRSSKHATTRPSIPSSSKSSTAKGSPNRTPDNPSSLGLISLPPPTPHGPETMPRFLNLHPAK
ncbi:hypothetical protein PGTUg99_005198 [Puccinia graminis f. sp. tritici]|uniref:Uncharacterized protein n=1 Tax=Puccinia graminis f. sp. tritici TaxID=56615 RepID=A0A5B0R4Q5_PUCGR|nr:hypothetical protein PGTUg99_005198 [Puccinia graminis f. sp. tritici]